MADLTDFPVVQPTPEEKAAYEQQFGPPPLNPIRDLTAPELADLASADKENFELVSAFRANKDLWADQSIVSKVADAHNLIRQRGFSLSDLPSPRRAAGLALDVAKGFGKQLWNYGSAAVETAMGIGADLTGQEGIARELEQQAQQRVAENIAGSEQALFGLADMAGRAVQKTGRALGIAKPLTAQTPEEKIADLWTAVGTGETQEDIGRGAGGFLTPVGGEIISELAESGKPVRPEETAALAAGDPFSFYTFGKAFQIAGSAVPNVARSAAAQVGQRAGAVAEQAAGAGVRTLGKLTELGGRAAEITGKAAPVIAATGAAISGQPIAALAILGGGTTAGRAVQVAGRGAATAGKEISEVGRQVSGRPIVSPLAQGVRDIAGALPGAAGEIITGTAADLGLAAVSAETPQQTESAVGIGTVLGAAGAAKRIAGRVISGQLIAPREYGIDTPTASSGAFPLFDRMHSAAFSSAPPGVRARLNAVRQFASGAKIDTDVFLAPDSATLEKALIDVGFKPEVAKTASEQAGFFTTSVPDQNGQPRRVIFARNIESAPHEAFHAFQDVLGESANQEIDALVRQEYGDQWESIGDRYARRLVDDMRGRSWEEVVLDDTGQGLDAAKEKLYRDVYNKLEAETGSTPPDSHVRDLVEVELVRIFNEAQARNPNASSDQFWREVLSPEEAKAEADRYIARELAAENFDAVFKQRGASLQTRPGLLQRLSRIVGNTLSTLGAEPLAGRRTEIGQIEPRFRVTERVAELAQGDAPAAAPATRPTPTVTPPRGSLPSSPEGRQQVADEARTIAEQAPEKPFAGGTRSPRELLGQIAEAIAQQAGVRINYLSAPGEPAAATTSNRTARRAIIEAFRTMPQAARSLWEKSFFPERVLKTKSGFQVMGWAPEVFAANAHKLARTLSELPNGQSLIPYQLDVANKTFTDAGWQQLFADTQNFVRNQMAGQTGAGEPLVVPRELTDRGFFAPQSTPARAVDLAQPQADTINMLFNFRLPDTPRVTAGKLPLNIAGQEISIATAGGPQRLNVPVEPRPQFSGESAGALGIEGRSILEVNPVRSAIESAAKQAKIELPSFIEAIQKLNLENIKEVELAPELPQFRGNTLTLTAGFQPSADPRAVKAAAVRDEQGKIYEGSWHGEAEDIARASGSKTEEFDHGFSTNSGEFLDREQAFRRAEEIKQISPKDAANISDSARSTPMLESMDFEAVRQFQPTAEMALRLTEMTPEEWTSIIRNYKGKFGSGLTGWAWDIGSQARTVDDVQMLRFVSEALRESARSGNLNERLEIIGRAQAAREAYEAATGRNLEDTNDGSAVAGIRNYVDPNYNPPMPPNKVSVQAQPKAESERTGLGFKKFFSDVTTGTFGKSNVDFEPVLDLDNPIDNATIAEMGKHSGNFDEHIAKSIPTFEDVQIKKAGAIKAAYPEGADVLDIGASEGSLGKTISALSKGTIRTVSLDPNPDMAAFFQNHSQVPGAEYSDSAFLRGFEDESRQVPAYDPGDRRFDVVNESMAFQFISPERTEQISEAKRLLKPDGILVIEEKVKNQNWAANEKIKDSEFKNRYFSESDLKAKDQKVGFSQSKDESKAVGMVDNMTSDARLEDILRSQFDHVSQYWDSGNFKGYVASDSKPALDRFIFQVGDVNSKFSTLETPRRVEGMTASEMRARLSSGFGQFQPEGDPEFKLRKPQTGEKFSKAWILPNGTPVQLGSKQHHEWLNENGEGYGIQKGAADSRTEALRRGFARINYGLSGGRMVIEARAADWAKLKPSVQQFVETNIDQIDNLRVELFNDDVSAVADSGSARFMNMDSDAEKLSSIPFLETAPAGGAVGGAVSGIAQARARQFQPGAEEEYTKNFFSAPEKPKVTPEGLPFIEVGKEKYDSAWVMPDGRAYKVNSNADEMLYHDDTIENFFDAGILAGIDEFQGTTGAMRVSITDTSSGIDDFGGNIGVSISKKPTSSQIDYLRSLLREDSTLSIAVDITDKDGNVRAASVFRNQGKITEGQMSRFLKNPFEKTQFQPGAEQQQQELAGMPAGSRPFLSTSQLSSMSRKELMDHFPEAIVPKRSADTIPSKLREAPLVKDADNPVQTYADKLAEFARTVENTPEYQMGRKWYSEFSEQLKARFGPDARVFAELLAATSPQTSIESNFKFALEALEGFKSGRFKPQIKKFEQGLQMIANEKWLSWYNRELNAGRISDPPAKPTPAAFMARWIAAHDIKPRQSNGKLFGINSIPVLQVAARRWLEQNKGPKVKNFVENLLGEGTEATIDLWADRTLRRLGYADFADRWRIMPVNKQGVSDEDFAFAQSIFRNAASQLGMKPSELQAAVWFAEKQLWADNGWSRLDLGDFREQLKKTDALRAEIRGRETAAESTDLLSVQPRDIVR